MTVPAAFAVADVAPSGSKACKDCTRRYDEHSGRRCALCREPVEHHGDGRFAECLAGRRRMAEARWLAGVPVDAFDRLVLEHLTEPAA